MQVAPCGRRRHDRCKIVPLTEKWEIVPLQKHVPAVVIDDIMHIPSDLAEELVVESADMTFIP